jgi:hypothetical protein
MNNQVLTHRWDFRRKLVLSDSTPYDGLLQRKTGTPPALQTWNGALVVALNATNEAQVNGVFMGDVLPFRIQDVNHIRVRVAADDFGAGVSAVFGVIAAANDTIASITERLLWRIDADNAVHVDWRNGGTGASGSELGTTFKEFVFDLQAGVLMRSPREAGSVGRRADVLAQMSGSNGQLKPVLRNKIITLAAYAGNVQPFIQIQKAAGTGAGAIYVESMEIDVRDVQRVRVATTTTTTTTTT